MASKMEKEQLGAAISNALKTAGVTKSEAMRRTGRTWPTINNWCIGKHLPSKSDLAALADLTGASFQVPGGTLHTLDPPYPAWKEFMVHPHRMLVTDFHLDEMRKIRWGPGRRPLLTHYLQMALAFISTEGDPE